MAKETRFEVSLYERGEFVDSFRCSEAVLSEAKSLLARELPEHDERLEALLQCNHLTVDLIEKSKPDKWSMGDSLMFIGCGVIGGMIVITGGLIFGIGMTTIAGWIWG